jgi:hypothetical protein
LAKIRQSLIRIAPPYVPPAPGFGIYPEDVLCPILPPDSRCGQPYAPPTALDPLTVVTALRQGQATFRQPAFRGACAGCHAPDGIDLAAVGYSDADIRRRALEHLTEAEAETIVRFVRAKRQQYDIRRLLHPAKFRPFQPSHIAHDSGHPVVDSHDAQAARDGMFAEDLTRAAPIFTQGRVVDTAQAEAALRELGAIDLTKLRLGIPFDRYSEDAFHGSFSIFEWVPGIATMPKPGREAEWHALVDAYLANPTDANLWAYYDRIDDLTECTDGLAASYGRACEWMRLKYKSVQILGHMLRHRTDAYPNLLAGLSGGLPQNADIAIHRNPMWEAGDFLRRNPLARRAPVVCSEERPCTDLPPEVRDTVTTDNEELIHQDEVFKQSWFMMSFIHDPALMVQGNDETTLTGDYLESVLLPYYDVHHAFVVAKMAAAKAVAREWLAGPGRRQGTGKIASVRTFSFKQIRDDFSPPATAGFRRDVHERMFANFARMWILLVKKDLEETGEIYSREDVLKAVRFMRTWVPRLEGAEDPAINAAVLAIEALALSARELRPANETGELLQPIGRWQEFALPYQGPAQ